MRILILIDCYVPSTKSGAKQMHDLAKAFSRLNHQVIVATPDDKILRGSSIAVEDGITVLRVRTGRIKGAPKIVRGLNEASLSSVLWRRGKEFFETNPCDLIVYYSPTIFFGALVRKLKRLYRCPSYLILRDIFPQWAVDTGVLRKGLAYRFFRGKELKQYAAADVIGVQSPANLRYFTETGLEGRYRLDVLYNWASLGEKDMPASNYRDLLGLRDKVVFFYGGNIGVAQDMDNIVRLARALQDRQEIHFLIVGDGSEVPRLSGQITAEKLINITIHGPVSQEEYSAMLSEFDVGLITLDSKLKTQNFPGKMFGYMFHGIPVLASINQGNDLKETVESHEAGLVSLNGDDHLFYEHALELAENPKLRERLGRNGRTLLEKQFSVDKTAEQILSRF
jgi:glycosyltransferase involved in cell wall biosynthesis